MPPPSESAVIALLMRFSQLAPAEQTRFLDVLNTYLYASPQRRSRLREEWRSCCDTCLVTHEGTDQSGSVSAAPPPCLRAIPR